MRFNKLIPELSVSDFQRSLVFYTNVLGFKVEYFREKFTFLSLNGSQIMIEEINNNWKVAELEHPFGRWINFQIEIKNIDKLVQSLKNNNYSLFKDIKDNRYRKGNKLFGCREFLIQDPDWYLLRFSQNIWTKNV